MKRKFESGPRLPTARDWGTQMVTIRAATGKRDFSIHAELLAYFSVYFRTALNSGFEESRTYDFTLTEHCNDAVLAMFTKWIYYRSAGGLHPYNLKPESLRIGQVGKFAWAWLFGDYIGAANFQNDVMRFIFENRRVLLHQTPNEITLIDTMWENVPEDSALDKLFMEVVCHAIGYKGRSEANYESDAHTGHIDEETHLDKGSISKNLSEGDLMKRIYKYPERVRPVLVRRMMHMIKVGRWDPNDDGSGNAPKDLWSWLKVDDFLVPAGNQTEEEKKRQRVGEK
ncbi:hypothetical protein GGR57DRAFT_349221 [Xylariaceae sp. FL1272]|nr:hypothetical protein GGR57DRAFT_349221 [Xylariaceae sp. FL1272]